MLAIITFSSCFLTYTICSIKDSNIESEWIFVEFKNPDLDDFVIQSWVSWSTGYGSYDSEEWTWFFRPYEIEIDNVHIEGYKDDSQQTYCVSYVSFWTKFTGIKDWDSGAKTFEVDIRCGHASSFPDVDHYFIHPFDQPSRSGSTTTISWGEFNPYGSNEKVEVVLAAFFYSSLKANVISSLSFGF